MGALFEHIQSLVSAGRYVVGDHASNRLDDQRILEWQVVHGIETATLLSERPQDRPNSSVEVEQILADGTDVKVIWAHITSIDVAKLVTVHFMDE